MTNQNVTDRYVIEKKDDDGEEHSYRLDINKIRLKVYDVGVAVLIIECENHKYMSCKQVNAINEYGRRINLPFLPIGAPKTSICADCITLVIDDDAHQECYSKTLEDLADKTAEYALSWNFIMKPIQYLLDGDGKSNGGICVTTHAHSEDGFFIKPCIDDRMFVCCLVRDPLLSEEIKAYSKQDHEYKYLATEEEASTSLDKELYKLIYVETWLTCRSANMRKRLLTSSVYDRWIDEGTLHAVSHHSVVCVTGIKDGLIYSVVNPFLTQIVEMAVLTVVQRSLQLLLLDKVSKISESFNPQKEIAEEQIAEVEKLQALYIKFQNQLFLPEVTVQEQGVELYSLLQEHLYLTKNKHIIDEQMNNLRDISNISHERLVRKSEQAEREQEKRTEKRMYILSIGLALLVILDPCANILAGLYWKTSPPLADVFLLALYLITIVIICGIMRIFGRSKKDHPKK